MDRNTSQNKSQIYEKEPPEAAAPLKAKVNGNKAAEAAANPEEETQLRARRRVDALQRLLEPPSQDDSLRDDAATLRAGKLSWNLDFHLSVQRPASQLR